MKRALLQGFGLAFVIWGIVLLVNVRSLTGLAVFDGLEGSTASVIGGVFVVLGVLMVAASRAMQEGGLEQQARAGSGEIRVFISRKASERAAKDNFVRNNLGKYMREIEMIRQNPSQRPQERVGEFSVSPRGHNPIRVAWHYDPKTNTLYIDDFRYHVAEHKYDDNWNNNATDGKITRRDYATSGYEAFSGSL